MSWDHTDLSRRIVRRVRREERRIRAAYRRRQRDVQDLRKQHDREHLIASPVFILCSARSGSTLLRSILDTHSQICAPHELHLNTIQVRTKHDYATNSWKALGYTARDLENLLWDRMLHRILVESGKRVIVDKTPQNVMVWQRIRDYWPAARYIHLRRHPASVVASRVAARPDLALQKHVDWTLDYCRSLNDARAALPGPTVRYEDLTADPEAETRRICQYLGVPWQERMLRYRKDNFKVGLGDWSSAIKSGRIQPSRPLPELDEVHPDLRELVLAWGYA